MSLENSFREIVVDRTVVGISIDSLNTIIANDLQLKIEELDASMFTTLPYMLVHYIRNWPGWDKWAEYEQGVLDINSWYQRFRQYIIYKMRYLIMKILPNYKNETNSEAKDLVHSGTNTDLNDGATLAKFSIDVAGPASLLSNLIFSSSDDHIIIEELRDRAWIELNTDQLINHPWIQVEFISPQLSFRRSSEARIYRCISKSAEVSYKKPNFIMGKHRINKLKTNNSSFQISQLEQYIVDYKNTISKQLNSDQQQEVDVILDQFYKDLVDISTSTAVSENQQVTFNIGGNVFTRCRRIFNKKTDVDNTSPNVIYNEVFLPKVVLSFRYFSGMQENTLQEAEGHSLINNNNNSKMANFKPIVSYKCTYCKLTFADLDAKNNILMHMKKEHGREHPLLCISCKKSFELTQLTELRWKCLCKN